jgi:hypothetical protein
MKKILSVLLMLGVFSTHLFSQTIEKKLNTKKIGTLSCSHRMSVKVGESDTTFYIYCSFQNQKYSSITDIGSVFITTTEEKDRILSDLKECVKYMDDKSISFTKNEFQLYDFTKNLYINDERGGLRKYTSMGKKYVLMWIEWLESIKKVNR